MGMGEPGMPRKKNENENDVNRFGKWVKLAVGILTMVAIIGAGIFTMTSTFAFKEDVTKQFLLAEEQTVKTFDQVQKQFIKFGNRQDIKLYTRELENLNEKLLDTERELVGNPDDFVLKSKKMYILERKNKIQDKLDKLME